jgi:hypothetical protein
MFNANNYVLSVVNLVSMIHVNIANNNELYGLFVLIDTYGKHVIAEMVYVSICALEVKCHGIVISNGSRLDLGGVVPSYQEKP